MILSHVFSYLISYTSLTDLYGVCFYLSCHGLADLLIKNLFYPCVCLPLVSNASSNYCDYKPEFNCSVKLSVFICFFLSHFVPLTVGAAVAIVGLAAYRVYAARKNASG